MDTIQVQVVDADDPDGDPLTFQYDWRFNGQLVQSTTSTTTTATLDLLQPGYGDLIEVFVTASDGYASSSAIASLIVGDNNMALVQSQITFLDYELSPNNSDANLFAAEGGSGSAPLIEVSVLVQGTAPENPNPHRNRCLHSDPARGRQVDVRKRRG